MLKIHLLQSSVPHDSSEIIQYWFGAQETFLIIINVKTVVWLKSWSRLFFFRVLDEYKIQKNSIYLKYKYFVTPNHNLINVFILKNKSISSLKNISDLQLFEWLKNISDLQLFEWLFL